MLVLEPARQSDLQDIGDLADQTLPERYAPGWWVQQCEDAAVDLLVARDVQAGRVVGFVVARREEPCLGNIAAIGVDPTYRGEGIGSALLRSVRRRMRSSGAFELTLEVRADDERARSFYQRHGFDPVGLHVKAYSDGSDAVRLHQPI